MKMWKILLPVTAALLFAGQASAQSDEDQREMEVREAEYSVRLREAEERMEQAAREVAELSRERLPQVWKFDRRIEISNRPHIGITIDGDPDGDPVAGVEIIGVTPGTAADDGGLHAGDIITNVNEQTLHADNSVAANKLLLEVMEAVEEGDVLTLEYLRNGSVTIIELLPRLSTAHSFAWLPNVGEMHWPDAPDFTVHPEVIEKFRLSFGFPMFGSAWGNMELVELSEGLGKYFGTDHGLLVVSAPDEDGLELQDGDVIQSIDGREPTDVRHALRILSSYESGEKLKLGIMRDKKKRTLDIEVPADHRGSLWAPPAVAPVRAPLPARPMVPPVPPAYDIST